jgi:TatD DNase family protein
VGECGLDASEGFPPLAAQVPWFEAQVRLAMRLRKPLFLHERGASTLFLEVLRTCSAEAAATAAAAEGGREEEEVGGGCVWGGGAAAAAAAGLPPPLLPVPAVVHCFTGTEAELAAYAAAGFHVGVTGHVCESAELREWLPRHVPLSRLFVETDAPYMGWKGCRAQMAKKKGSKYPNVPAALPAVVEAVAAAYGVPPAEAAEVTAQNARAFFGMAAAAGPGGDA